MVCAQETPSSSSSSSSSTVIIPPPPLPAQATSAPRPASPAATVPSRRSQRNCPLPVLATWAAYAEPTVADKDPFMAAPSAPHALHQQCPLPTAPSPNDHADTSSGDLSVETGDGMFRVLKKSTQEHLYIRNLGTNFIELVNFVPPKLGASKAGGSGKGAEPDVGQLAAFLLEGQKVVQYWLESDCFGATGRTPALASYFSSASIRTLAGEIVLADPVNACGPLVDGLDVSGKVVYVDRGGCAFADKVFRLQVAGAAGVVVGNVLEPHGIFMMGGDGSDRTIRIPALMVSVASSARLKKCARERAAANNGAVPTVQGDLVTRTAAPLPHAAAYFGEANVPPAPPATAHDLVRVLGPRGSPESFQITTLGGWTILVKGKGGMFNLHFLGQ